MHVLNSEEFAFDGTPCTLLVQDMHAVYIAHDSVTLSLTSQDQEADKDARTRVPYHELHHRLSKPP